MKKKPNQNNYKLRTNRHKIFTLYFFSLFLVCNCKKVEDCQKNEYFPMGKNYYWVLSSKSREYADSLLIKKELTINNKCFYEINNYMGLNSTPIVRYFNNDSNGNIIEVIDTSSVYLISIEDSIKNDLVINNLNEQIIYRFNADSGQSWYCFFPNTGGIIADNKICFGLTKVTLIKVKDTISIGNKIFSDCRCFMIDILNEDDEKYFEWYAPGVGVIKRKNIFNGAEKILINKSS